MPSASVSLPGPEQRSRSRRPPRRARISSETVGWLQRPDQNRRSPSLCFGDKIQHAVDPIGQIDVGSTRPSEEDLGPLGQPHVGMACRVIGLVALGLHDGAGAVPIAKATTDQLAGD